MSWPPYIFILAMIYCQILAIYGDFAAHHATHECYPRQRPCSGINATVPHNTHAGGKDSDDKALAATLARAALDCAQDAPRHFYGATASVTAQRVGRTPPWPPAPARTAGRVRRFIEVRDDISAACWFDDIYCRADSWVRVGHIIAIGLVASHTPAPRVVDEAPGH